MKRSDEGKRTPVLEILPLADAVWRVPVLLRLFDMLAALAVVALILLSVVQSDWVGKHGRVADTKAAW